MPPFKFLEKFKSQQESPETKIEKIVEKQRNFLEKGGIVYDDEFKKLKEQDTREYKVVLDMDGTLIDQGDLSKIRPGAKELLENLQKKNIKIIIWTSAKKEYAENALKENLPYDILVARENYYKSFIAKKYDGKIPKNLIFFKINL